MIFRKLIVAVAQSCFSSRAIGQAVRVLNLSFDRIDTATRRRDGQGVPFRKGENRAMKEREREREREREKERERKKEGKAEGK